MKHLLFSVLVTLGISASPAAAQTLQQCADFTSLYCTQAFPTCFGGREYQQVSVNKSFVLAANSIGMTGTVTFLDALGLPKNNYFELVMTLTPYNTMEVKFAKLNQLFGSQYWEYCNQSFPMPQQQQPTAYQPSPTSGGQSPAEKIAQQQMLSTMYNNTFKAMIYGSATLVNNFKY